jgi:hypothetical protein
LVSDEDEGASDEDESEDEHESIGDEGNTTRSNAPPSDETDGSTPPRSKPASPEPNEEHPKPENDSECLRHGIDYDDAVSREVEDADGMPAFINKKLTKTTAQEETNEQLAGYVPDEEIDEKGFLAQYGQGVDVAQPEDGVRDDRNNYTTYNFYTRSRHINRRRRCLTRAVISEFKMEIGVSSILLCPCFLP